jgi:hypothetical protein
MNNDVLYLNAESVGRAKVEKVGKLGKARRTVQIQDKVKNTYFNNEKICKRLNNREKRQNSRLERRNKQVV